MRRESKASAALARGRGSEDIINAGSVDTSEYNPSTRPDNICVELDERADNDWRAVQLCVNGNLHPALFGRALTKEVDGLRAERHGNRVAFCGAPTKVLGGLTEKAEGDHD